MPAEVNNNYHHPCHNKSKGAADHPSGFPYLFFTRMGGQCKNQGVDEYGRLYDERIIKQVSLWPMPWPG
jgi:hypothetical protein